MVKKMCGDTPKAEELEIGEDEYLPHDQHRFPFFTGLPSRPPRVIRAEIKQLREAQLLNEPKRADAP
jgi:hypothetical protein